MKNVLVIGLLLSLVSCSYFADEEALRPQKPLLTEDYARSRSQKISNVSYQLQFDLTNKDYFQGTTVIHFQASQTDDLTVDFVGGEVQELLVNGEPVRPIPYKGFFIEIPAKFLQVGRNALRISYTHPYSKDGVGLYRYEDVEDGRSYLYSHFEPYYANRMFPCFDQPDLKATFSTQVLAPKGWQVITATRESEVTDQGQYKQWLFPASAKFSTYTYSLHAGDYVVWEDLAKTKKQEIPLRLFARQSLAKYVKHEDWFTLTKQGFDFFESYFSYPYPYLKYDQVLVPDFNASAMENVAAITFNEDRFVAKGEKTREQRRSLAATLFHEMAHMWFGNLVTMQWWNDLWLNESFATHASTVGMVEATEFKEAWKVFNNWKQRAYLLDQSVNTHPITQDCPHTQAAFANFDSITYTKGASALKQLAYLLGEKTYRKGLKKYFSEFAEGNTTLKDFMDTMVAVSGKELHLWQERWLETEMMNEVEVFFTCRKGRINLFEIYQTGTQKHPTLRTHKTRLALFRKSGGVYKLNKTFSLEYSGEATRVTKLEGQLCPDIVYPNYDDHDFVSVRFDQRSLQNIETSLATMQDSAVRSAIWSDLWMMVLNQKMSMERFLEIAEFNGLVETDMDILDKVVDSTSEILRKYYPDSGQPWVAKREVWLKFFEQSFVTKIYETTQEPDFQKQWFQHLVKVAESPDVFHLLEKVIKRHQSGLPLVFEVDQDLRWTILARLAEQNYPENLALIEKEKRKDNSKRGELRALLAETLQPNLENKEKFFSTLLASKGKRSFGNLRTIMWGLFPAQQKSLHKKFSEAFFDKLRGILGAEDVLFASTFVDSLAPTFCDQKSSTQLAHFIASEKGLPIPILKRLKGALFENQRCYEMRKVLKKSQMGDNLPQD